MKLVKLWEAEVEKAYELQSSFEKNENGFMNPAYGFTFEQFKEYVEKKRLCSLGIGLPEGHVPDTVYLLEDKGVYVGIFNFRHYLTDGLKSGAGHIGYGVGKRYRQNGYATKGLGLLIALVKNEIPEDEFYLSVHKENSASLQVQLKNGAYIHHEDEQEYYTRIKK